MYCVHCGSKVANNQKFCSSCGANIPNPENELDADDQFLEEEDSFEESSALNWPFIRKAIIYASIAVVLFFTNPSEKEVEVKVARTMIDLVSDKAGQSIGYDIGWLIDSDSFTDKEALRAARQFGKISVENYYLFKVGSYTPIHKHKSTPIVIGICDTSISLISIFKPWID